MLLKSHLQPPCWYSAIEHGRPHHGTPEQRAREWQRLVAQGVQNGLGDMLILAPGFALWVELKHGANKQTDAQVAMQQAMARLRHGYAVVRSVVELGNTLVTHGIPLREGWQYAAAAHDAALSVPAVAKVGTTTGKVARRPTLKQVARGNRLALVGVRNAE